MMPGQGRWLLAAGLLLAGCVSSAPPAPPVRYFDPLPESGAVAARDGRFALRCVAAPHLGREFVVRTGPRELVFDAQHSWIAEPRDLVVAALERAKSRPAATAEVVEVHVAAFELDLTGAPRAHVRVLLRQSGNPAREIEAWAPVAGSEPEAYAAAMAEALGAVATDCQPYL